jgi:hypothetical protein
LNPDYHAALIAKQPLDFRRAVLEAVGGQPATYLVVHRILSKIALLSSDCFG